jgi:replication fork protection complex subunit Csm3/Swi3
LRSAELLDATRKYTITTRLQASSLSFMTSIEDIWDEPIEEPSQPRPLTSTSRKDVPLFLVGSDDDEPASKQGAAANMEVDIDAMFAGVVDANDAFSLEPLASDVDTEGLKRKEINRHKNTMQSLTPHQIMSSSPPRELGDEAEGGKKGKKETGKEGKKERRKISRLDEGKLLGPDGFPGLIKEVKRFKPKGKGYEVWININSDSLCNIDFRIGKGLG